MEEETDLWICSECGKETDTIYTIAEWCDEKGIDDETKGYLYDLADKQNMCTDICEDCFDALFHAAGF